MADSLHLTVLTPDNVLVDAAVSKVRVKLVEEYWLSIYPHHLPLIAETLAGPVQYVTGDGEAVVEIAAGILQVVADQVTIFTGKSPQLDVLAGDSAAEAAGDDTDAMQFDRLARELFIKLGAFPNGE